MNLTSKDAYQLLIKDVITKEEDLKDDKNKWINHCIYVALASERIANKLNIDSDKAKALGYIHDIGRKINHFNHPIEGYKYMIKEGYPEEARVCLTHSFIDNDIMMTAGGGPEGESYKFILNYLESTPSDIYDNIVQLSDLFCLETGFTTIENRLLDITKRKGIYSNSLVHYKKTIELKKRIEEKMGCSLYSLFPEITKKDLDNIESDHESLLKLLNDEKNYKKLKR